TFPGGSPRGSVETVTCCRDRRPGETSMPHRSTLVPTCLALALLLTAGRVAAQTTTPLVGVRFTPDSIRREMAIPSHAGVRGRIDSTGYALHADQMAKAWELGAAPPPPDSLGPAPAAGV